MDVTGSIPVGLMVLLTPMRHFVVSIMEIPLLVAIMGTMLIVLPIYGIVLIHKKQAQR